METENEKQTEETKTEQNVSSAGSGEIMAKSKKCKEKCAAALKENGKVLLVIFVAIVLVAGSFAFKKYQKKNDVGSQAVKTKIEQLIKESGGSVKEVVKDGDLYKVTISINGQEQPAYVTKDGKKLVQGVITFDEIEKQKEAAKKQEEENNKEVSKTDKPVVDLFVMSFCPYGNKAEDTMKPVYDLLKNKVDFNFHYIVSVSGDSVQSLHGEKEVAQNEREACVLKNYGKDKWFGFVSYVNAKCGSAGECWEAGAKSLGLDVAKITACVTSEGLELMKANQKSSEEASASGSPTMKINGTNSKAVYKYGTPEEYKKAICDSFNTAPAECSKKLAAQTTAGQTADQGGSCN